MPRRSGTVGLAVDTYRGLESLGDDTELLNLSWTLDERDLLELDLDALVADELRAELAQHLESVNRYMVLDPYGESSLRPAIEAFFGHIEGSCSSITCGAGVNALLCALAGLARGSRAWIAGDVYPDFPVWVARNGGVPSPDPTVRASVVFLERPGLVDDHHGSLTDVQALCEQAARSGSCVVIDESNANYYPPSYSAVTLLPGVDNLVVLRGLSKAYQLGGLRLGYAVSSRALEERVRGFVAPMLASSLSIRIGRAVLERGDLGRRLRATIERNTQILATSLADAGLGMPVRASRYLPYVFLEDDAETGSRLEALGIRGKRHAIWSRRHGSVRHLHRLSAPLAPPRLRALRERLAASPP